MLIDIFFFFLMIRLDHAEAQIVLSRIFPPPCGREELLHMDAQKRAHTHKKK